MAAGDFPSSKRAFEDNQHQRHKAIVKKSPSPARNMTTPVHFIHPELMSLNSAMCKEKSVSAYSFADGGSGRYYMESNRDLSNSSKDIFKTNPQTNSSVINTSITNPSLDQVLKPPTSNPLPTRIASVNKMLYTPIASCEEQNLAPQKIKIYSQRREKEPVMYDMSCVPHFVRNFALLDWVRSFDRGVYSSQGCRISTNDSTKIIDRVPIHSSPARNPADQEHFPARTGQTYSDFLRTTGETIDSSSHCSTPRSISFDESSCDVVFPNGLQQTERKRKWIYPDEKQCVSLEKYTNVNKYASSNITFSSPLMRESIIWVPQTREEWEQCSDEMTKLCDVAASRRKKKMTLSLPKIYIQERIDIDDPLWGFQIRHRTGGWLQGFVLMTTFTTWTYYFKWDSLHPKSGMIPTPPPSSYAEGAWDKEGLLSAELESQPRSGDPNKGGVIWPTVAEISLVGAMGCGEYLLRMAMDDIARKGCYDYIVLQATEASRGFYEKFGFARVGAITRYGREGKRRQRHIVGYRHWTYADEKHLRDHGGPSYMMARRVDKEQTNALAENERETSIHPQRFSFLDALSEYFVHDKPNIISLNDKNQHKKHPELCFICTTSEDVLRRQDGIVNDLADVEEVSVKSTDDSNNNVRTRNFNNIRTGDKNGEVNPMHFCFTNQEINKKSLQYDHRKKRMKTEKKKNFKFSEKGSGDIWLAVPSFEKNQKSKRSPPRERGELTYDESHGGSSTIKTIFQKPLVEKRSVCVSPTSETIFQRLQVDMRSLKKQKITAVHRNLKPVFFNKVVTRKMGERSTNSYHFVIHYDEEAQFIRVVQLEPRGEFTGKREGRTKWKAKLDGAVPSVSKQYESNPVTSIASAPCTEWDIVPAAMVTKTSVVADESWDIFDD